MRKKLRKYRWFSYPLLINPEIAKYSGAYVEINNVPKKPEEQFRMRLYSLKNKRIGG